MINYATFIWDMKNEFSFYFFFQIFLQWCDVRVGAIYMRCSISQMEAIQYAWFVFFLFLFWKSLFKIKWRCFTFYDKQYMHTNESNNAGLLANGTYGRNGNIFFRFFCCSYLVTLTGYALAGPATCGVDDFFN